MGALFPDLSTTLHDVINCYRLPVSCEGSPPGFFYLTLAEFKETANSKKKKNMLELKTWLMISFQTNTDVKSDE